MPWYNRRTSRVSTRHNTSLRKERLGGLVSPRIRRHRGRTSLVWLTKGVRGTGKSCERRPAGPPPLPRTLGEGATFAKRFSFTSTAYMTFTEEGALRRRSSSRMRRDHPSAVPTLGRQGAWLASEAGAARRPVCRPERLPTPPPDFRSAHVPGRNRHRHRLRASACASHPRRSASSGMPDKYGLMSRIGVPSSMSTPRT